MFEGIDELFIRGAVMAIGGGAGMVVLAIMGRVIVNYVLAKYGKSNGKADSTSRNLTLDDCHDCRDTHTSVLHEEFGRFREEFKEEIREERDTFKDLIEGERAFTSSVNDRLWKHVNDRAAHGGGNNG